MRLLLHTNKGPGADSKYPWVSIHVLASFSLVNLRIVWKMVECHGVRSSAHLKISHHHLDDHVKNLHQRVCCTCSTNIFFQAIKLLIFGDALSLLSSFLKIPITPGRLSYAVEVSANCDEPEK